MTLAPHLLQMFERNLEVAFVDMFRAGGLPESYISGAKGLPDTFVEMLAELGAGTNLTELPDGRIEYDHYAFTFTYRLITPRPADTYVMAPEVRSLHEEMLGRARDLCRLSNGQLNARLSMYRVLKLEPAGCQRTFNEVLWADQARQVYYGELTIPADQFQLLTGPEVNGAALSSMQPM